MNAVLDLLRRGVLLLWRHRWTFLVPLATLLLPATIYAVSLPDTFEAEAVVQVRPLKPGSIDMALPQESTDRPEEILSTVRSRLFARENLRVALAAAAPEASGDDARVLEAFAEGFGWETIGLSSFALDRTDTQPERATTSVNTLLEAFLEGARAQRLRQAERNQAFHQRESEEAQQAYDEILSRIDTFRSENGESLPDREGAITAELRQVEAEIGMQVGMAGAIRARVEGIDGQLSALYSRPVVASGTKTSAAEEALQLQLVEEKSALGDLKHELAEAMATKTDRHPDVVRLRGAVAVHQASVVETTAALEQVRRDAQGHANDDERAQLAYLRESLLKLRGSAETAWKESRGQILELRKRSAELTSLLHAIPHTKAALDPLLRDKEQVAKRLEVRAKAALDAKKITEHFRTGDLSDVTGFRVTAWAVTPVRATGPGRWRFLLTAIGLGLLAGYGLLLLKRRHEGATVHAAEDVADLFPSAIVVRVPPLDGRRRSSWPARLREGGVAVYVVVCLGFSVYLLAVHKGWLSTPGWLEGFLGGGGA